jgi:hypothetical protein
MNNIRQFAADIAAHLGDDWQLVLVEDEDSSTHAPHIRKGPDGPELWLSNTWSGKGRIYVGGNYPKDAQGRESRPYFSTYSENGIASPSITFAETKTAAQAAKDIARRFLPSFLPLWEKQKASVDNNNSYRQKRALWAKRVAEILQGKVITNRDGLADIHLGYRQTGIHEVTSLDADLGTVNVSLRGVTLEGLQHLVEWFGTGKEE